MNNKCVRKKKQGSKNAPVKVLRVKVEGLFPSTN